MTSPLTDQTEREYLREQEAGEQLHGLRLVRRETAGGEREAEEEAARLAKDFAETTDSANFIIARFAETEERFPDFSKRVRCLIDAVVGATAGAPDFVEVTDEELAERMGCSTKTLQNARNEFRAWPGHTKLIEIKEHWRDKDTLESHPHAYRCHLSHLAAETTLDARLSPGSDRGATFRESARVTADSAQGFVARPAKRRKKKTDSELLLADVKAAAERLRKASARQTFARRVDRERLEAMRREVVAALAEFDAAFGFQAAAEPSEPAPVSTQSIQNIRSMETGAPAAPDVPSDGRRMETPPAGVESPQVEKFSTQNDPTESTTYDFDESESGPDFDLSEWVWMEGGEVQFKFPPPNKSSPQLEAAIQSEVARLRGRGGA